MMAKHSSDKFNEANPLRHRLLKSTQKRIDTDGINSLNYYVTGIFKTKLYTKVIVGYDKNEYSKAIQAYTKK